MIKKDTFPKSSSLALDSDLDSDYISIDQWETADFLNKIRHRFLVQQEQLHLTDQWLDNQYLDQD